MDRWIARLVFFSALTALLLAGCGGAQISQLSPMAAPAAQEMPRAESDGAALAYDSDASLNSGVERKVIGRASLALVVADTDVAVSAIETAVEQAGGFVANANFYKSGPSTGRALAGSMTLRVPAAGLDQLLAELEGLALSVESRAVSREDVTDQYTDLTARLTNLEATERELLALLTEVRERPGSTAEEILQVHARMSEIRGEIESVRGRKNLLDNLIGLATVEVSLTPDALNRPIVEDGWQPTGVARSALRGLVSTLQWIGSAAIWLLIFFLPLALIAAIPLAALVWVLRWLIRRTRRGKEMKEK
ncbi:MAG: DUF4349 domain-containing protein [Chloroflexi bacterium]|nr:DUF4349 domain-containing protein [Chloroflexota bacterium]